jgi:hypothetical protein
MLSLISDKFAPALIQNCFYKQRYFGKQGRKKILFKQLFSICQQWKYIQNFVFGHPNFAAGEGVVSSFKRSSQNPVMRHHIRDQSNAPLYVTDKNVSNDQSSSAKREIYVRGGMTIRRADYYHRSLSEKHPFRFRLFCEFRGQHLFQEEFAF